MCFLAMSESLCKTVESLVNENFCPFLEVSFHRDTCGCLEPCCASAMAVLRSEVVAAAAHCDDGLQGVLSYLGGRFAWGVMFETHLCGMMKSADQLDCGAMTAVALLALNIFLQQERKCNPRSPNAKLALANVQLILRDDVTNSSLAAKQIRKQYKDRANLFCRWMRDDAVYHQVVGIYSTESRAMMVWDFQKWLLCPAGPLKNAENAIVAIRVNTHSDYAKFSDVSVSWDGMVDVPLGKWTVLLRSPSPAFPQVDSPKESQEGVFTPTTLESPTSASLSSSSVIEEKGKMLVVYASGCHVSSNPMTGVGISRSVRAWFDDLKKSNADSGCLSEFSSLHVVGVDDMDVDILCGLVDPVFDQVRTIVPHGQLRQRDAIPTDRKLPLCSNFSPELSDQALEENELWESVVAMLCEAPRVGDEISRASGFEAFFLPVRKSATFSFPFPSYFSQTCVSPERRRQEGGCIDECIPSGLSIPITALIVPMLTFSFCVCV